jgi:predicted GNAT family acetyltransferase
MTSPQESPTARVDPSPLDRPPWSALTTAHARFSLGNDLARRYRPEFAPLASIRDISDACLSSLHDLMRPGDVVGLFSPEPVASRQGLTALVQKTVEQMVYWTNGVEPPAVEAVPLTAADVPAMMELAELTHPGPFAARTIELGAYIGVRSAGALVAMAGERMTFDGFTEISAVCTHPDHRGKGYASALVRVLMRGIVARGAVPFLHVFSDNKTAEALYAGLGFAHRCTIAVSVLQRAK